MNGPRVLNIPVWMIVQEARTWLAERWHHQGRVRGGVDCVGLLVAVGNAYGLIPRGYDYTSYGREPTGALDGALAQVLDPLPHLQPGAVVSLRLRGAVHHVGIIGGMGDRLTLIHSYQPRGCVVEHGLNDAWRRRVASVYGYRGVCYCTAPKAASGKKGCGCGR